MSVDSALSVRKIAANVLFCMNEKRHLFFWLYMNPVGCIRLICDQTRFLKNLRVRLVMWPGNYVTYFEKKIMTF